MAASHYYYMKNLKRKRSGVVPANLKMMDVPVARVTKAEEPSAETPPAQTETANDAKASSSLS